MLTVNQILTLAKEQVGVRESPAGSNKVKYNTAYYGKAVSGSAYPWCCVFIWWLFDQLKANDLFFGGKKTASCTTLMDYAKKNGLFVTKDYKPGDLIFFNWDGVKSYANHIGICVEATSGAVICIEGNTSLTNQDNGGNVMERKRYLTKVVGAYRPKYAAASKATTGRKGAENVTISVSVLKQGAKGDAVKALQILLNGYGFSCGSVDGSFGPATLAAVKAYQKANGLTVDGSVGPATWTKLLG